MVSYLYTLAQRGGTEGGAHGHRQTGSVRGALPACSAPRTATHGRPTVPMERPEWDTSMGWMYQTEGTRLQKSV